MVDQIRLGRWTEKELDEIIINAAMTDDTGDRIASLSEQFLGVPYAASTLSGGADSPEIFTVNLEGLDCFTFLDYVEAMRLSGSFADFLNNLKAVRYRDGVLSYRNRNHFFTDWREYNPGFIADVTGDIGGDKAVSVSKRMNQRDDGSLFLTGISIEERVVRYIPADEINNEVLGRICTGYYAGIYCDKAGLDVSHAGIMIRKGNDLFLRHASSGGEYREVVDQELTGYLSSRPGLVILRPVEKD